MKKPLFIFAVLLVAGIVTAFVTGDKPSNLLEIGAEAPMTDYKMTDISGASMSLADLKKENGLLVVFSCNTCPFVIGWEDRYPPMAEHCNANNIGMVAVNSNEAKRQGDDSMEEMKKHAKAKDYNFSYVVDPHSELAKGFGATKTPQVFLFNKDMKLVYTGAIDDNMEHPDQVEHNYLQDAVGQMLAGKPCEPNSTRAIGCSIKKVKAE